MTTQVPPSALLPLNPEQLARLQAATTDLTPTQLAWVSGYFWGVLNQQPGNMPLQSHILVLFLQHSKNLPQLH
mgnify:CR=1 FL=1